MNIETNLSDKQNICLVGFMFSGKTTIGSLLSKSLKWHFIDTDLEIEKENLLRIKDIFEYFTESLFRQIETRKIEEICKNEKQIISIGGGAFCSAKNIKIIKDHCIVIYLKPSFDEIKKRLTKKGISKRPLFQDFEKAEKLFQERQKYYSQAHFIIDTNDKIPKDVKKEIKNILKKNVRLK